MLEIHFQIALLLIFLPPTCQNLVDYIKTNLATLLNLDPPKRFLNA